MASNVCIAQKAVNVCGTHTMKKLTLFCRTCKKNICTACARSYHTDHDWDEINAIVNERRACLPTICKEIRETKLPALTTLTAEASDDQNDECLQLLEKKRISIIEAVNKLIDEKKEKFKTLKQKELISHSGIKDMLNYMDTITTSLDENVHTFSDFDVLEMEQEMMSTLAKLESLKLEKVQALFIPGQLDHNVLSGMIGEVVSSDQENQNTMDVTELHSLNISTYSICPVQNGRAWIRESVDKTVKLFDKKGKEIEMMKYRCNDFVVLDNGDHVFTDKEIKEVRVTCQDGSDKKVCNTHPLIPTRIRRTCGGDLLITLRDDLTVYTITPTSRRLVQRMNMTGEVMASYEFHEDGKTRLFTLAGCTTENSNGDLCVINRMSVDSGNLIVLNKDGRLRANYNGRDDSAKPFDPWDVACDSKCRIIVSDYNNRSLHVLSNTGTFLRYLLPGLSKRPEFMSLYDDLLWLSLVAPRSKMEVKVYRYK